jgi:putative membrane protein
MSTSFDPHSIERPHPLLWRYYVFASLLAGPAFPIALVSLYCRYITLRYKFDSDGVKMSYGVLFKREVNLTYRRLQDIHLTHNLLQRWMGLATISLQTASGNAGAEMSIEGVLEAEALRDYLYARMRGAKDDHPPAVVNQPGADGIVTAQVHHEAGQPNTLQTLIEIRDAMQKLVDRQGVSQ